MADAWVSARFAQRTALIVEKRKDTDLLADLRRRIMNSKRFRRMSQAVEELHPRRAGRELANAMESRVNQAIEDHLHRLLDEELQERRRQLEEEASHTSADEQF